MARSDRTWHPKFVEYMNFIVNHPNYNGMPNKYKEDGSIRWVVSGNSEIGIQRDEWWQQKVKEFNTINKAEVARLIHPEELRGMKPCQICGKELSIFYIYPNANTIKLIERFTTVKFLPFKETVYEIISSLHEKYGNDVYVQLMMIFGVPNNVKKDIDSYFDNIIHNCFTKLSPGVMSNAPDRFDGFHTYNACCRSKEDTGRHTSNLSRYTQDRRAYENWAEGNFNLANRLMGEFGRYEHLIKCPSCGMSAKMSADHIGPISLGFTHRLEFNALCKNCNSAKNNRMTYCDVQLLLKHEKQGINVISWHSKYIWDRCKNQVTDDASALKLSEIMRQNLHNILILFANILQNGGKELLLGYLHPEYAYYDYRFINFHPLKLNELKIIKNPLSSKNKQKNAERYLRISFESLNDYIDKSNRRVREMDVTLNNDYLSTLFRLVHQNDILSSHKLVSKIIEEIGKEIIRIEDYFS